ncbi:MAG: nucleotidyltransferase family protein [Gemmatimonadetes bacterium]|nr:nucleotidyltransferase family protein [Gemmatimonadota bacterium]
MRGIELRPETALLRCLLRPSVDRAEIEAVQARRVNWHRFEEVLFRSKLVPLAGRRMENGTGLAEYIPAGLRGRLAKESVRAAVRTLLKEKELAAVVGEMEGAGIRPLVLKGLPFAQRHFVDASARDIRDLDLLIPPEHLPAAEEVLAGLGYHLFTSIHSREYYRRHHFHLVFVRMRQSVDVVELHWNLLHPRQGLYFDTATLFRAARPEKYGNTEVMLLEPIDEILYMMISYRMSSFLSLKRLVDLAFAIENSRGTDWRKRVLARGAEWGLASETEAAFHFLHRFWGDDEYGIEPSKKTRGLASRYRGEDFFGVSPRRSLAYRMWCASCLSGYGPLRFAGNVLVPNEQIRSELYYTREEETSRMHECKRFISGLGSLVDLGANWALSPFRKL